MMIVNYMLNKFMPLIIICGLLIYKIGIYSFETYIVIGLVFYISQFNYKVGYSVGICESNGINLE